ncbi:MAG: hypothetical protein NW214_15660 [Pseudanabaenaceae cyanobacterium bins.39]|nr:hypothetical protein [Pseudanabaenaceae cyanobacterium bins.39]
MVYVDQSICGNILPKYLGTYEIELAPIFEKLLSIPFTNIIDVGAAEGYYAVGCALKFPCSRIVAFEGTEQGRQLLEKVIQMNNVSDRVQVRGYCTPEDLKSETDFCQKDGNKLLIMDVEGAEEELLCLHKPSDLSDFYMIIELHDWVDPNMGERIIQKFSSTHFVTVIEARTRQFSDLKIPEFYPLRLYLSPSLLAFSYERPLPMRWIYLEPI